MIALLLIGCTGPSAPSGDGRPFGDSGAPVDSATPTRCDDLPWIDVAVSAGLACGVHEDGCAECWGKLANTPAGLPPEVEFVDIDLSGGNSDLEFEDGCGLAQSGSVFCWGRDLDGEVPTPDGSGFEAIAVGSGVACGMTAERPICWGWPDISSNAPTESVGGVSAYGSEYVGHHGETVFVWSHSRTWTVDVPGLRFVGAAAGAIHVAVGSELQVWQDDSGPVDGYTYPLREDAVWVDANRCLMTEAGEIDCYMSKFYYGDEHFHPAPSGTFRSMDSGNYSACAVRSDGHIICWGLEEDGGLRPPGSYN